MPRALQPLLRPAPQNLVGAFGRLAAPAVRERCSRSSSSRPRWRCRPGLRVPSATPSRQRLVAERRRLHGVFQDGRAEERARAVAREHRSARRRRERHVHRPRRRARGVPRAIGLRRSARCARRQSVARTPLVVRPASGIASERRSRSRARSTRCPRPSSCRSIRLGSRGCARCSRSRRGSSTSRRCCSGSRSRSSSATRSGSRSTTAASEIEVTKLVGGTDAFIRRPFLYLGLCYGLAGAVLAALLIFVTLGLLLLGPPVRDGRGPLRQRLQAGWPVAAGERHAARRAAPCSAGPAPASRPPATCEQSSPSSPTVTGLRSGGRRRRWRPLIAYGRPRLARRHRTPRPRHS